MEKKMKEMWLVAANEMMIAGTESRIKEVCENCYFKGFEDCLKETNEAILVYDMLSAWETKYNVETERDALASVYDSMPESTKGHIMSVLELLSSIKAALSVAKSKE